MSPDELRERILRWEGPHTDFKARIDSKEDLAKDLVCFPNSDGGQVVVGVAKERTIAGVDDPDALMLRVDDVAFNRCRPPVTVVPEVVRLEDVEVVVLNVAKGDQRPYSTASGRYYVRSGTRCRQPSREEILRLFQASGSLFFDEMAIRSLDLTDLDLEAVSRHLADLDLEDADDPTRLLRNWRLYDGEHPTVAGVSLFGRNPQDVLEASKVVAGAVAGGDIGDDFVDRTDLRGGLFALVQQAEAFLQLHLRTGHEIAGFEPERRPAIPTAALREAVVNALVHRDYSIPGPCRIFVLADRVEVRSPGRPPNTVDADAMRAGIHVPRNPHIYSRVVEAELATRTGTGIRRIARLLRDHGGGELGITISDAEVVLTLPRSEGLR
jgi:ATP-dependent DNA helicase RecG